MKGRLIILQHPDPQQRATWVKRLGLSWNQLSGVGVDLLARDAPIRESIDGRAAGVRTGVLFNLDEERAKLRSRGIDAKRLDGDGVCIEAIGSSGPRALSHLARHGLVSLLHRSQGGVLVTGDAQGLAPLYMLQPPEGGILVAGDRQALRMATALPLQRRDDDWRTMVGPTTGVQGLFRVPPGIAILIGARGVQQQAWHPEGPTSPFLRHRPQALLGDDLTQVRDELDRIGAAAVSGWRRDRGDLAAPQSAEPEMASWFNDLDEGTQWPNVGWSLLGAELAGDLATRETTAVGAPAVPSLEALLTAYDDAFESTPFRRITLPEPESRLSPERRRARWLRYTLWRCGPLERLLDEAAARDQPVALPHLAPTMIAALGALPDGVWPWQSSAS